MFWDVGVFFSYKCQFFAIILLPKWNLNFKTLLQILLSHPKRWRSYRTSNVVRGVLRIIHAKNVIFCCPTIPWKKILKPDHTLKWHPNEDEFWRPYFFAKKPNILFTVLVGLPAWIKKNFQGKGGSYLCCKEGVRGKFLAIL